MRIRCVLNLLVELEGIDDLHEVEDLGMVAQREPECCEVMSNPAPRRHLPLIQDSAKSAAGTKTSRGAIRRAAVVTVTTILSWALLASISQYASSKWVELRFGNSSTALELWLTESTFSDRIGYYALTVVVPALAFVLSAGLGGLAVARVHDQSNWADAGLGGIGAALIAWGLTCVRLGLVSSAAVLVIVGLVAFMLAVGGHRMARRSGD
jgi:hypothetical protein